MLPRILEDPLEGGLLVGLPARGEHDVRLRHRQAHRVGAGTTAASATAGCSSRTDSTSKGETLKSEDLKTSSVRPTYVMYPSSSREGDIAGVVVPTGGDRGWTGPVVEVPGREVERTAGQVEADLALTGGAGDRLAGRGVDEDDRHAGHGPAHRADDDPLAGELPIRQVVSVWPKPSRIVTPQCFFHLVDDLGVERLAGPDRLAQHAGAPEVGLDEHPPDGGRGAEGGHPARRICAISAIASKRE